MSTPVFRTDVNIRATNSQTLLDRPTNIRGLTSSEHLDNAAESANKQIDNDIKAMLDAFEALVGLSRIRDKDKFRIAQESFELEARADVMVRAAQSLTLLSHSLKLSLLLIQEPIESAEEGVTALDEEAIELIKSTAKEKERCARLLEEMFGLSRGDEGQEVKDTIIVSKETEDKTIKVVPDAKKETQRKASEEENLDDEEMEMSLVE